MIDRGKQNLLGVLVDAVDYDAATSRILAAAREGRGYSVTATAVHGIMEAVRDAEHRYRLNHLDLVVPDGQPVRWGLNWLYGVDLPDRVYGPELMVQLCSAAEQLNLRVFLYGSHLKTLADLTFNLVERFPSLRICGTEPSQFRQISPLEKQELVSRIMATEADILFVGLGCPRQEVFAYEFTDDLQIPVLAVGAAFDFHAGSLRQAPGWMQRNGLEWLYRWIQEPRRLAGRYGLLNPMYLGMLCLQAWGLKAFDTADAVRPDDEVRFA